jgi:hypothetical protein
MRILARGDDVPFDSLEELESAGEKNNTNMI